MKNENENVYDILAALDALIEQTTDSSGARDRAEYILLTNRLARAATPLLMSLALHQCLIVRPRGSEIGAHHHVQIEDVKDLTFDSGDPLPTDRVVIHAAPQ